MAQKPLTYILLILLIGGGFLVGSFFGGSLVGGLATPSDHRAIVADFKLYDDYYGYLPSPTCVSSGTLKYAEKLSIIASFQLDEPYQFSFWIWQRKGDVEMSMEIWGPDDSGHIYGVCFGRTGLANGGHIEYKGVEVMTIQPAWTDTTINGQGRSHVGEYAIEVER